jgi:tetratricopeptide (TPR) repeat protein
MYWIHAMRASVLYAAGSERGALESFDEAIDLAQDNPLLLNARARLLSTAADESVRNSAQAIADAQMASALVPDSPNFAAALAIVYAESGDFMSAVEAQMRAIGLLQPGNQDAFAQYQERLALYEQMMPFERSYNFCSVDDEPANANANGANSLAKYLVFCLENNNS